MKTKFISLLAIILGMTIIIFPMIGAISVSSIIGLSVLLVSIYLLVVGVAIMDYNKHGSILDLVLGILLLFLSIIALPLIAPPTRAILITAAGIIFHR